MSFIGRGSGFSQRHYTVTESSYCPSWAIRETAGLVRSPVTLDLIREDMKSFASPSPRRPDNDIFNQVVVDAYRTFRVTPVKPIHLNELPHIELETSSSSPGLPWKPLGYHTKGDILRDPQAYQSVRKFWHRIKEGGNISPPDCAAYLRSHLVQEGEVKVRAVWGYPATIGFQEACFALPLIAAYKLKSPIAYGFETARGGCRKIANRFAHHRNILSSDFKSFDKTIPAWLIRIAFDILCTNIDFTAYAHAGVPHSQKLYRAWQYIVNYFINTPVRLCNGERYRKRKGVASGSYFTQLIDSVVNWIVTTYALRSSGNEVHDLLVMGDDSLAATKYPVDLDAFAINAQVCGMKINVAKSETHDSVHDAKFLGYKINHGVPLKEEKDFWAALRFPERPDSSYDDFASRALGLLVANFGIHKLFDWTCRLICSVPYQVKLAPSMRRYLKILGIDSLPSEPPSLFRLGLMRF